MTNDDWQGRYDHIDQILNVAGPRTDPAFMAGDGVSCFQLFLLLLIVSRSRRFYVSKQRF